MRWRATGHRGTAPDPETGRRPDDGAVHQAATHQERAEAGVHAAEGRRRANDRFCRTLIELGRSVLKESEPESVLERVLEAARRLTGAGMRRWGCWTTAATGWSGS
jgi:hypothetical protein